MVGITCKQTESEVAKWAPLTPPSPLTKKQNLCFLFFCLWVWCLGLGRWVPVPLTKITPAKSNFLFHSSLTLPFTLILKKHFLHSFVQHKSNQTKCKKTPLNEGYYISCFSVMWVWRLQALKFCEIASRRR